MPHHRGRRRTVSGGGFDTGWLPRSLRPSGGHRGRGQAVSAAHDPNLDGFYDYAKYGEQRVKEQAGEFNELGYIGYTGAMSLDELMMEDPAEQEEGQTMGGMT